MSNKKVDRAREISKIWLKLNQPKVGDVVKFRAAKKKEIHVGVISEVIQDGTYSEKQPRMTILSDTMDPGDIGGGIYIVEINGIEI